MSAGSMYGYKVSLLHLSPLTSPSAITLSWLAFGTMGITGRSETWTVLPHRYWPLSRNSESPHPTLFSVLHETRKLAAFTKLSWAGRHPEHL